MSLLRRGRWSIGAAAGILILLSWRVCAQNGANICVSCWSGWDDIPVNVSTNLLVCVLEPITFTAQVGSPVREWTDNCCAMQKPDDVGSISSVSWKWTVGGSTAPNPTNGVGSVAIFTNYALGVGRVTFEATGTYVMNGQTSTFSAVRTSPDYAVVGRMIAMDGDGDLQIDFNNLEDTKGTNTFWLNDDYDVRHWVGGDSADGWAEDDDKNIYRQVNCEDNHIGRRGDDKSHNKPPANDDNCLRDLEDFTVVQVKVPGIVSNFAGITYWLKFENATGNPSVNLFKAITNGVVYPFDYLTNSIVASNQVKEIRVVTNLGSMAQQISTNYINRYDQPVGFLLEGRTYGEGDLTFIVKQGTSEICRSSVFLDLKPITNFYDVFQVGRITYTNTWKFGRYTIRKWTTMLDKWKAEVTTNAQQVQATTAYAPEPDKYLLFVHGWNVPPDERQSFAETVFKRLWWQGYRGGYGMFDWPTLFGFVWWKAAYSQSQRMNFDDSEMIAWLSATALTRLMGDLNTSSQLCVLAHSQGNVVVGEALRKYDTSAHPKLKAYIAAQAAIGGSLYSGQLAPQEDFGWRGALDTPNIMAYWYSGDLSTTNQPYLAGNSAKVQRMCNYFNSNDYALVQGWQSNNRWKPDDTYGYAYGGSTNFYEEDVPVTNRFCRYEAVALPVVGLEISTGPDLRERYEILSYCAESRLLALGQSTNSMFPFANRDLQGPPLNYDKRHYSHSREFRSSIPKEGAFFENIIDDGGF